MAIFNSGTKTLFQQTSAPTGWTKDTVLYNNHALRVVSGSASSGGTIDFTTVFTTTAYTFTNVPVPSGSTDPTTLSSANLPVHNHPITATAAPPAGYTMGTPRTAASGPAPVVTVAEVQGTSNVATSGSGSGHSHPLSCIVSGTVCTIHLKYVDVIVATLN